MPTLPRRYVRLFFAFVILAVNKVREWFWPEAGIRVPRKTFCNYSAPENNQAAALISMC